jgi:hypothetical protein
MRRQYPDTIVFPLKQSSITNEQKLGDSLRLVLYDQFGQAAFTRYSRDTVGLTFIGQYSGSSKGPLKGEPFYVEDIRGKLKRRSYRYLQASSTGEWLVLDSAGYRIRSKMYDR